MMTLNLDAPIVAGISAAGFHLGMKVSKVEPLLATASRSRHIPTPINSQLATGKVFVVTDADDKIRTVFFGEDVRLGFNQLNELYYIGLSGGYRGLYLGKFGIGVPLKAIHEELPLEFDDGDEMNYPLGPLVNGVSFGGACCSLEDDPEQLVFTITVHDWSRR